MFALTVQLYHADTSDCRAAYALPVNYTVQAYLLGGLCMLLDVQHAELQHCKNLVCVAV